MGDVGSGMFGTIFGFNIARLFQFVVYVSFADWLCFLWSVLLDFILYSCTLLEITEFPLNIQTYEPQCKYKHVAKLYHSGRAGEIEVITCPISIGPSCGKHAAIGQRPPQVSDAL